MKKILVLCTGNSCRSQMAEAYLRKFALNKALIYSAGIETHGLNINAVKFMAEDGIDISKHSSNHIDEYSHIDFDFVITVCDHAKQVCPNFPSKALTFHQNFIDPSKFHGNESEIATAFRTTRSQIKDYCEAFIKKHLS